MDPCARQVCYLLQFLSASAEEQIAISGALLPVNASDLTGTAAADDNTSYELYWTERQGTPLTLLLRQLELYFPMFFNLDENTLPPDETILEEIMGLLNLMVFFQGNTGAYNRFWSADSLRHAKEWKLMRRLSQMALAKLGWPVAVPEITFAAVLHG
jgi:hypothetical protein